MDVYRVAVAIVAAFICELVDASLGMGFGTTLTPILLAFGFEPVEIVPAVLFAQAITGTMAGVFHHEYGNIHLGRGSRDRTIAVVLTAFGVVGIVASVLLAVRLPVWAVRLYIGLLVFSLGIAILLNRRRELPFSWGRIAALGFIAAFNKGISGGGYGPVVTSGQVMAGVRGRTAVGIGTLTEGITAVVGVLIYVVLGVGIPWRTALPLTLGALLSVPIAAWVVSRMPTGRLTMLIGGITTTLGGYTLLRLII